MHNPEIVETAQTQVACEGEGGPLGHPRVFLHILPQTGHVTCPYCSRQFVYTERPTQVA